MWLELDLALGSATNQLIYETSPPPPPLQLPTDSLKWLCKKGWRAHQRFPKLEFLEILSTGEEEPDAKSLAMDKQFVVRFFQQDAKHLSQLRELDLTYCNALTMDAVLAMNSACSNLETLRMPDNRDNELELSTIALSDLKRLSFLKLNGPKYTSVTIRGLPALTSLTRLDVPLCASIEPETMTVLSQLTGLRHLDCGLNLNLEAFQGLTELTHLGCYSVFGNQIRYLSHLPKLHTLALQGVIFEGDFMVGGVGPLPALPSVQELIAPDLVGGMESAFHVFPNLTKLETCAADEMLEAICQQTKLRELDIGRYEIATAEFEHPFLSGIGLAHLSRLTGLTRLRIREPDEYTARDFIVSIQTLGCSLRHLELLYCPHHLNDTLFTALCRWLPELQSLYVSRLIGITTHGVTAAAILHPGLEVLRVLDCPRVHGIVVRDLTAMAAATVEMYFDDELAQ